MHKPAEAAGKMDGKVMEKAWHRERGSRNVHLAASHKMNQFHYIPIIKISLVIVDFGQDDAV